LPEAVAGASGPSGGGTDTDYSLASSAGATFSLAKCNNRCPCTIHSDRRHRLLRSTRDTRH
jgi:hypothetical protein